MKKKYTTNAGMLECWNARMLECQNAGMPECQNAKNAECTNAGMLWEAGMNVALILYQTSLELTS